jgi:hypothetical protein
MKKENNTKNPLGRKVAKIYTAGKVSGEPIAQISNEIFIQLKINYSKKNIEPDGIVMHPKTFIKLSFESFNKINLNSNFCFNGKKIYRSEDIPEGEFKFTVDTNK